MHVYGLIGYPLTHSFSKKFFTEKFEREELSGEHRYELFPIQAIHELPALLQQYPDLRGLNVTIPYKEQVIAYLDHVSPVVSAIGACNCIRIENGLLYGHNTDVIGFRRTLLHAWKPAHNKALILGTGGAAKAVAWVLEQMEIPYHYVSRTTGPQRWSYESLSPEIINQYPLIINTTPLGMYPAIEEAPPIPYEAIGNHHYLFDLVYNPAETLFLKRGREQGAATLNGSEMLIIQAEESWKIWQQ